MQLCVAPVKEIRPKLASFGNWSRDDSGGRGREHKLYRMWNHKFDAITRMFIWVYLEKPLWILFVIHWVIEIFWSATEEVSSLSIRETPPNRPIGGGSNEGVLKCKKSSLKFQGTEDIHRILTSIFLMRMLTVFLDLQRRNKNSNLDLLQTPLTLPASRKAKPHCMMKIMMLMTTRKSASSSAASTCSWSKSSRVWLARISRCFWSTDSKSKSDMVVQILKHLKVWTTHKKLLVLHPEVQKPTSTRLLKFQSLLKILKHFKSVREMKRNGRQ